MASGYKNRRGVWRLRTNLLFGGGGVAGRGYVILHRRGLVGCVLEAELVHVAAALRLIVREPLAPLFDVK